MYCLENLFQVYSKQYLELATLYLPGVLHLGGEGMNTRRLRCRGLNTRIIACLQAKLTTESCKQYQRHDSFKYRGNYQWDIL